MGTSSNVSYPRTGKRGVPQQFPRRLFEMLEGETNLANPSSQPCIISWSDSGKAFRISNVEKFTATVLPRYFRTKKFSSFQRNLNLYGFTKVRRGPDTDMYAHPSFVRDQPERLSLLRKSTSNTRRQPTKSSPPSPKAQSPESPAFRAVSPSPSREQDGSSVQLAAPEKSTGESQTYVRPQQLPSKPTCVPRGGIGRLDLLALAIEQEECYAT